MTIWRCSDDLFLIDLPQKIEGFRKFISSWVYLGDKTILVDPGPKSTVEHLLNSLKEIGVRNVDYILLTHIHIDHAGGLGDLVSYFKNARVIVNEKGKKHLINPEKLWEGSLKVLGDVAIAYGDITPVPEDRFAESAEGVEVIYTPGHAVHHQSYVVGEYLFSGEAFGVAHGIDGEIYQRPATPPKFILEISLESIEKLKNLGKMKACIGHFGMYENSLDLVRYAEKQLEKWVNAVFDALCCQSGDDFEKLYRDVTETLRKEDPRFGNFDRLERDVQKREEYFIRNSIKGMLEYVRENKM